MRTIFNLIISILCPTPKIVTGSYLYRNERYRRMLK
jgi:hypothetical protein